MGFFKNLFRDPVRKVSPLEQRLSKLNSDSPELAYQFLADSEFQTAGAISMAVLLMSHRFCNGLLKMEKDLGKVLGASNHSHVYDVIAFEVAAYSHYWLMKEYLRSEIADDYDEDESPKDQRFEVLRTSTHLTNGFLNRYVSFDLHEHFFQNRANSYCRSNDQETAVIEIMDRFERNLISSILVGSPAPSNTIGGVGNLELELAVKAFVPIFHSTYLDALTQVADNLFDDEEDKEL